MERVEYSSDEVRERIRGSISADEVRAQTDRVCRSDAFDGLTNAQKVFRYLVARAIDRKRTTAREIALEALGKRYFDRYDSQPRQEVGTIRKKLEEFYKKEAKIDDIWLEIQPKQFDVFWRHSPKTLLGRTEGSGWVKSAAKLSAEDATRATETAQRFWPALASSFPVYCAKEFGGSVASGKLQLSDPVKMFFDSIGSYHLFVTSFDRSEIRLYPLKVWLDEWARDEKSEEGGTGLDVLEFWGHSAEVDNKAKVPIHSKLLNALNLPKHKPLQVKLSFDPGGFLFFDVPKPLPRSKGKYLMYEFSYASNESPKAYYLLLVPAEKDKAFKKVLGGKTPFDLRSYAYILESGVGEAPKGMKERLRKIYSPILAAKSGARLTVRR